MQFFGLQLGKRTRNHGTFYKKNTTPRVEVGKSQHFMSSGNWERGTSFRSSAPISDPIGPHPSPDPRRRLHYRLHFSVPDPDPIPYHTPDFRLAACMIDRKHHRQIPDVSNRYDAAIASGLRHLLGSHGLSSTPRLVNPNHGVNIFLAIGFGLT